MAPTNPFGPMKRFITTYNPEGKAVFSTGLSEDVHSKPLPDGEAAFALGWTSKGFPVDFSSDADLSVYNSFLENAPGIVISNGTVLRTVDMAPGHVSPMHRTVSLDYGVVIEGEMELILDSGETRLMKRGDMAIQRGTTHAWRNASDTEWARMVFVLQPCKPIEVNGKKLGEDLETMQGVRASD